jgi:hypothetical protein
VFLRLRAVSLVLTASVAVLFSIVELALANSASSSGAIPRYAYKVAEGRTDQKSLWSVWLFGQNGVGRCWGTRTVGRKLKDEQSFCGFAVPRRPWQLAAQGSYMVGGQQHSMVFFLTRPTTSILKVVLVQPKGTVIALPMAVNRLTQGQARRAHMRPSFGYTSSEFAGRLGCIRRIAAIDDAGRPEAIFESSKC